VKRRFDWRGALAFAGIVGVIAFIAYGILVTVRPADGREMDVIKLVKGDVDTLARTVFGEARGEKDAYRGMAAVALVVLNRAKRGPPQFPSTITEVCRAKHQFTCWSASDPNAKVCAAATEVNPVFALALHVASGVLAGRIDDFTHSADHYHTINLRPYPYWASRMTEVARIGSHVFYRSDPTP
jgi:N-acetylmuramoyl-L-alanine amidase